MESELKDGETVKGTDFLAIYASVLSTVVFIWNIGSSRPRIKVDLIHGIEGSGAGARYGVFIVVRNVSSHEVHLAAIDVLYSYRQVHMREWLKYCWTSRRIPRRLGWCQTSLTHYSIDSGCPIRLEARTSRSVFIPEQVVEEVLSAGIGRGLIGHAQDQLWKDVYSRPFTLQRHSNT